jgi:hypothetical protein
MSIPRRDEFTITTHPYFSYHTLLPSETYKELNSLTLGRESREELHLTNDDFTVQKFPSDTRANKDLQKGQCQVVFMNLGAVTLKSFLDDFLRRVVHWIAWKESRGRIWTASRAPLCR